ncbi:MAG: hypothetical protein ABI629_05545 [bacterium]
MIRVHGRRLESRRGAVWRTTAVAVLMCVSGCTAMHDGVQLAKDAFDPGVPGPKPMTADAAAQLNDTQIEQRLQFVTQRLDDTELHAALWYYGFLAVNAGGMIAGAATAAVETDEDSKIYDILNSSLGLIGTGYLLAAPLPGRSGSDPVTEMPFATHEQRAAQLAEAETILYGAAGRARQRTGWLLHVGNVALNAAAASVLLARESYGNAALLFFVNTAIGEGQILLTPWEPETNWQEYQDFVSRGGVAAAVPVRWGLSPMTGGKGLALHVAF